MHPSSAKSAASRHLGLAQLGSICGVLIAVACGGTTVDPKPLEHASAGRTTGAGGETATGSTTDVGGDSAGGQTAGLGGDDSDDSPGLGGAPPMREPSEGGATNALEGLGGADSCGLDELKITAPNDTCEATYTCDPGVEVWIECDGENDGTNTSLCGCKSGSKMAVVPGLIDAEAPDSCRIVLPACLQALGL